MGALDGLRVIEIAGRGPGPFAGMMLSDMGAEVVRVDRIPSSDSASTASRFEPVNRGRKSIALDLKRPEAIEVLMRLVDRADVLYEGFRPGVAERLGFGPEVCLARKPSLVYARATGWGQTGPLSQSAGHDIDYIAVAGALDPIGVSGGPPVVPLNLVGDYAGGAMLLAFGILCGVIEARSSGIGQVVDAAMIDGASLLMTMFHGRRQAGAWRDNRGSNYVDGGAPYYAVYETLDHKYVAVGAIERQFREELFRRIGYLDAPDPMHYGDWPEVRERLASIFLSRTRDEWSDLLEGTDACFAPVLGIGEVANHPHMVARSGFLELAGVGQPAPAPRFSRTHGSVSSPPPAIGEHTRRLLSECGFTEEDIAALIGADSAFQAGGFRRRPA